MSSTKKLYDNYHCRIVKTRPQKRMIGKNNFTYINFFRYIFPYIRKSKKLNSEILDVGCGAGTLSLLLANYGYKVDGIDISKVAIENAVTSANSMDLKGRVKFEVVDINQKDISKKYDIIICLEVLEHISNDLQLLKKLNTSTRKNGIFVLSVPLKSAPILDFKVGRDFDKKVGHLRRYSKDDIVPILKMCGFTIIKIYTTEGIIRNAFFVVPLLGGFVKLIKGPLSSLLTLLDDFTGKIFGYSDLIIICKS